MNALYGLLEDGNVTWHSTFLPTCVNFRNWSHHFLKAYPLMGRSVSGSSAGGKKASELSGTGGEEFIIMQPKGRPNDEAEEVILCYNRGGYVPNIVSREKEVQTFFSWFPQGLASPYCRNMPSDITEIPVIWWLSPC